MQWARGARPGKAVLRLRVTQPVIGLYQSIPTETTRTIKALDEGGRRPLMSITWARGDKRDQLIAEVRSGRIQSAEFGVVTRTVTKFGKQTYALDLGAAYLRVDDWRAPSFVDVPGVVPLVPGRGVPTVVYLTLQSLRMKGVPYGGLRRITSTIDNLRTGAELLGNANVQQAFARLRRAEEAGHDLARETPALEREIAGQLLHTQTGQYVETIVTQSGHRIAGIEISGVSYKRAPFRDVQQYLPRGVGSPEREIDVPTFDMKLVLEPR